MPRFGLPPEPSFSPAPSSGTGRVEAVARAARILKAFDITQPAMTVRQIAEKTGISRSSCHATATTLVAEGLLEAKPGGGYQLGHALAPLGGMVLERTGLVERATPRMEGLSWRLGGEVHLAYSAGDQLSYLVRVRRDRRVSMPNRYGEPLPLHRTGAGWAVLLAAPTVRLNELLTGISALPREVILSGLETARQRGFVVHHNYEIGICSVAAPIRMGRSVTAAISVAQPRPLMDEKRIMETGQLVMRVCHEIENYYSSE